MKVIGLVGSAVRSGRTRKAVEVAMEAAAGASSTVACDIIDLSTEHVAILDGRPPEKYPDTTVNVISRLGAGDAFVVASPIYRGTYTGALKNVLDHLPLQALEGKVVGLVASGASLHHYLAIDHQLRGVLAWFNAYLLPGSVYVDHSAFLNGELVDSQKRSSLEGLGRSLVSIAERLRGAVPTPACLAREMMAAIPGEAMTRAAKPQIVSVRTTASSKLFVIESVKLLFTNGNEVEYERVSSDLLRGAVIIVPMLDPDTFLLVEEYVVGLDRYELGLPKGLVQEGESTLVAANRELMEETGYRANRLLKIHTLSLAAGFMCYETDVVVASDLVPCALTGDEPEPLEVLACSSLGLDGMVRSGRISDARSIAALYVARNSASGGNNVGYDSVEARLGGG